MMYRKVREPARVCAALERVLPHNGMAPPHHAGQDDRVRVAPPSRAR